MQKNILMTAMLAVVMSVNFNLEFCEGSDNGSPIPEAISGKNIMTSAVEPKGSENENMVKTNLPVSSISSWEISNGFINYGDIILNYLGNGTWENGPRGAANPSSFSEKLLCAWPGLLRFFRFSFSPLPFEKVREVITQIIHYDDTEETLRVTDPEGLVILRGVLSDTIRCLEECKQLLSNLKVPNKTAIKKIIELTDYLPADANENKRSTSKQPEIKNILKKLDKSLVTKYDEKLKDIEDPNEFWTAFGNLLCEEDTLDRLPGWIFVKSKTNSYLDALIAQQKNILHKLELTGAKIQTSSICSARPITGKELDNFLSIWLDLEGFATLNDPYYFATGPDTPFKDFYRTFLFTVWEQNFYAMSRVLNLGFFKLNLAQFLRISEWWSKLELEGSILTQLHLPIGKIENYMRTDLTWRPMMCYHQLTSIIDTIYNFREEGFDTSSSSVQQDNIRQIIIDYLSKLLLLNFDMLKSSGEKQMWLPKLFDQLSYLFTRGHYSLWDPNIVMESLKIVAYVNSNITNLNEEQRSQLTEVINERAVQLINDRVNNVSSSIKIKTDDPRQMISFLQKALIKYPDTADKSSAVNITNESQFILNSFKLTLSALRKLTALFGKQSALSGKVPSPQKIGGAPARLLQYIVQLVCTCNSAFLCDKHMLLLSCCQLTPAELGELESIAKMLSCAKSTASAELDSNKKLAKKKKGTKKSTKKKRVVKSKRKTTPNLTEQTDDDDDDSDPKEKKSVDETSMETTDTETSDSNQESTKKKKRTGRKRIIKKKSKPNNKQTKDNDDSASNENDSTEGTGNE